MLVGTSFCPQQARPLSPYLGLWSLWTERPQDQIRKKLTIKITTKCLSQGRSTDSKSLAAFTWQSLASMDRHFSCAENCIQRYLLEEIYIFLKNISEDSQIPLVTLLSSSHTERSQLAFESLLTGYIHYLSLLTASHTLSFPVGTTIRSRGLL